MKRIIFIFVVTLLFSSCQKNKCRIIVDCMGNDLQTYCGTEKEIKDYCSSHNTPTCAWSYRSQ